MLFDFYSIIALLSNALVIVVMRDQHSKKFKKFFDKSFQPLGENFQGVKRLEFLREHFAYVSTTQERMKLYKTAVSAIAVIHQYDYENGHPPFEVC